MPRGCATSSEDEWLHSRRPNALVGFAKENREMRAHAEIASPAFASARQAMPLLADAAPLLLVVDATASPPPTRR